MAEQKRLPKKRGRPKGSTLDKKWRLTPNQMAAAEAIVELSLEEGMFPASAQQVAKLVGLRPAYVRTLLKKPEFQEYFNWLLSAEGVVLEGAFWRSMALGLSIGDVKVMELYARMTGKIAKAEKDTKVEVVIKAPEGTTALPSWNKDVIEAEVVSDE